MVDIAVNKVLAAASRHEARDFVDLALIDRYVLPLWHAIWAAPGKDNEFNPGSLIEHLREKNHFDQARMNNAVDSLIAIDATEVHEILRHALDAATVAITRLPSDFAGNLFVSHDGEAVGDVDIVLSGFTSGTVKPIGPKDDGAWPSGPDIDRVIIETVIGRFGPDGSTADMRPTPW